MLPRTLFVGPTKTGTTWIDDYLRTRADVALPGLTKETFFFDKQYDRGLGWYEDQFTRGAPLCVEVAPSLFHKREAAERVARDLPGVQVVCSVRDPLSRAVSHYFHYLKAGAPAASFAEMARRHPDIIEAGLYFKHVCAWRELVGPENVHLVFYDDIVRDPDRFVLDLCALLGLPHAPAPASLRGKASNAASLPAAPGLARLVRNGADWLRRNGAHAVVNALKRPALLQAVYGRPLRREETQSVRTEAEGFRAVFSNDQRLFSALAGRACNA